MRRAAAGCVRRLPQPLSSDCRNLLQQDRADARSPPWTSIDAATGSSQFGAPGCAAAALNQRRPLVCPAAASNDEGDVVVILPLRRLRLDALLQQRDRLIGAPRSARIRFAQKDRAESVGNREVRIERRRQVEQRIELLVAALRRLDNRSPP